MSVTVSAVPIFLIANILSGTGAISAISGAFSETFEKINLNDATIRHIGSETIQELQSKEFKTNFVDRDTLVKTLTEHGGRIDKEMLGYIECKIENFKLKFYKETNNETTPYTLKIEYSNEYNLKALVEDINSEYITNTQEASYNKVIKRLEEKNMSYEEDVYEDDTIVITVNLD